jgi:N-glycosylase/DNA lyase
MLLNLDLRSTPFDLESTLQCGQLFRWEKHQDSWHGVVKDRLLTVQQTGPVLSFDGADADFVKSYFRLDDNLPQIISEINRDLQIEQVIQAFPGLRLARQDPWECLISYICATYKNIPAIKRMIFGLSKRFGSRLASGRQTYYTFPKPDALATVALNELRSCGLGFRARRVREAAQKVTRGDVDFEQLRTADYTAAKAELQQIPGVGNKVADCTLLFSLEKLEAFPIDVRIKRLIEGPYSGHFDKPFIKKISDSSSLSKQAYDRISTFARSYFGRYAGYAQEYLYHSAGKRGATGQPPLCARVV